MWVCSKLFTVTCLVTCSSWAGIENKNRKISGFTYKEHREKIVDFS